MTTEFTETVTEIARHYMVDPSLPLAVVRAEGGTPETILKAVQCAIPNTKTVEEAIGVVCRSAAHALSDFVKAKHGPVFVDFFALRWAPRGVANDPRDLNRFWSKNVKAFWLGVPPATRVDIGSDVPGGGAA